MLQAEVPDFVIEDRRHQVSAEEWATRVELAACYRLADRFGWSDLIWTHISAVVPGPEHHVLLNPFGLSFGEITASNLVKVALDGTLVDRTPYQINKAGYLIHSAIHQARPDVTCVLHVHTEAGMAVSMLPDGLEPLSQHAMRFHGRLAYHDYEGIVLDEDEKTRLVRDLGSHRAMILRNHGFLTAGRSIGEAFTLMFYMEKAARSQLAAMAACAESGGRLVRPPFSVAERTALQFGDDARPAGVVEWSALIRGLDRLDSSYQN